MSGSMEEQKSTASVVSPETFFSLDIRVGTVVDAKDFPEAHKPAYRLWIDFGPLGVLQSSAQLNELYSPEDLQGRQVVAVTNIGSRRVAGFRSDCLVLGVNDGDGAVVHLRPERPVTDGERVY